MASARSCSGRAPARSPRSRRISARLFRSSGDVGVVGAVGRLGDGQRAFLQRPGPRRLPQVPQDLGQVVQVGWRRRGGRGRRPPHRCPARVPAAAGPPPDPPGPAGLGQVVQARGRRRGDPGRRPPHRWPAPVPAAAGPPPDPPGPAGSGRGCSGRGRRRGDRGRRSPHRWPAPVPAAGATAGRPGPAGSGPRTVQRRGRRSGWIRAVGGLGRWPGRATCERPGRPPESPQVPQDHGEVVQTGRRRWGDPGP